MTTPDRPERLDPAILKLAVVIILGLATPLLDSTIVSIAVRALSLDFHAYVSTVQWVGTAYKLAMAIANPMTGWATERFGAKRLWLLALSLFLVGSLLSGSAWSIGSLIGFRVLQGIGAGVLMPLMQTLLFQQAKGKPSGAAMALISVPSLIGPILGPVIGGVLLDYFTWPWIFLINPPICLVAIILAWKVLPDSTAKPGHRLDIIGVLTLSPGFAAVVYGFSKAGSLGGFNHPQVLIPALGGLVLLGSFVLHARRVTAPLIDFQLFKVRSFSVSTALLFLAGLATFGPMMLLPLYFQQIRGESVVTAGLLLAPQGIGIAFSRAFTRALDRFGPPPIIFGGVILLSAGTAPFIVADQHTSIPMLVTALIIRGAGLGAITMSVMLAAYSGLRREQVPHASTTTRIALQLGGSFGTAILASILQNEFAKSPGMPGMIDAFGTTFTWALILAAIAAVPSLLYPRRAKSGSTPGAGGPGGSASPVPAAGTPTRA
jgi:EmrB/QacA subfamily drug resistance transporter